MRSLNKHLPLLVLALLVLASFLAMEAKHPYFFLQDDNRVQNLPLFVHCYRALLSGEVAHFNFFQLLGTPALSNAYSGALYPPNFLSVFLSGAFFGHVFATLEFSALFHLMVAALSFYALARFFGFSGWAAAFGGYGWAFCGFVTGWGNSTIHILYTAAFLPLCLFLSLRMVRSPSWRIFLAWTGARTLFFFSGHPQFFLYSFLFEAFVAGVVSLPGDGVRGELPLRRLLAVFACHLGLVAALSAPLLLPALRQMSESAWRQTPQTWENFSSNSLPFALWLKGVFLPLSDALDDGNIFNVFFLSHFGWVSLFFLAAAAALWRFSAGPGRRAVYAFAAGGLLALFFSCDLFYVARLAFMLPVIDRFRWLFKALIFVSFSALFVACAGYDLAAGFARGLKGRARAVGLVALSALFALHVAGFLFLNTLEEQRRVGKHFDAVPFSEPWANLLRDGRVVSLGFKLNSFAGIRGFSAPTLGFNYATLFGLMQFSGYEILASQRTLAATLGNTFTGIIPAGGSLSFRERGGASPVAHFRRWGVRWYLVDNGVAVSDLGDMSVAASDGNRFLLYDPGAMPLVYVASGGGPMPQRYGVGINAISVEVDAPGGGSLVVNTLFNPLFRGFLDGEEVALAESADSQVVAAVPPGKHRFELRYVDPLFKLGAAVALGGALLALSALFLFRGREKASLRRKIDAPSNIIPP